MDFKIYKNDLLHRNPGFSFVETPDGDRTKVEFKDAGLTVIFEASDIEPVDAYKNIMINVLEGYTPSIFMSTTIQRDALDKTKIPLYLPIWNIDTDRMECFDGVVFTSASGATIQGVSTHGSLYENNSSGSSLSGGGVVKGWTTALSSPVENVTFLDNAVADRLVIGAGGAGDYFIDFSASFTNSGGNLTSASIYKNEIEQVSISSSIQGDSGKHRGIVAGNTITLAENDYISLRFETSDSGDNIKVYQCHVNLIPV